MWSEQPGKGSSNDHTSEMNPEKHMVDQTRVKSQSAAELGKVSI